MKEEIKEVLRQNLKLPEKFLTYEEHKGVRKSRLVTTDVNHFIDWIDQRMSVKNIWDYTLRMIEGCFGNYSKNEDVLKYYLDKGAYK